MGAARLGSWRGAELRRALFASDLHLRAGDPAGVARACAFLDHAVEQRAQALFLLGDVFSAWLGPPSLSDPGLAPFLDGLARLTRSGVPVVLVQGNHDFLLGEELTRACGVEVCGEGLDLALAGRRVHLEHGDGFCTNDLDYIKLHRVLRHPLSRRVWACLPRAALQAIARRITDVSDVSTTAKPAEVTAMVDEAVAACLGRDRDVIICGHVHAARDARLPVPGGSGRLLVMADFETTGSHVRCLDGQLELVSFDARFAAPPGVVVTLDGPAGCGKSSVAKRLAVELGFVKLDSGALYRAVTAEALACGLRADAPELPAWVGGLSLASDRQGQVLLSGRVVPDQRLRQPAVSAAVSQLSAVPAVRAALLEVQRRAALGVPGLVAEGRDMATVVFPDARHRFYLDARPEVRAARRLAQSSAEGASLEQVGAALAVRDARDSGRSLAPLSVAPGAEVLDTSDLSLDQVVAGLAARVRGSSQGWSGDTAAC